MIDPKFPQAIGIAGILDLTALLGNFRWEVLQNEVDDSRFFTSDFPVAIEETNDQRTLNKIVPLLPDLALRIVLTAVSTKVEQISLSQISPVTLVQSAAKR